MQRLFVVLSMTILISCSYERIFIGDVDKLTTNQTQNNRLEIDEIKKGLIDAKIDTFPENMDLLSRLENQHKSIYVLSDSIDFLDREMGAITAKAFIAKNFNDLTSFTRVPLEMDGDTPRPLLKLYLRTLEAFSIKQARNEIKEGRSIKFDHLSVRIIPDKMIYKNGEKISGQLMIDIESNFEDTKLAFGKILINGNEVSPKSDGWRFEIQPIVKGNGLVSYELYSEAFYRDLNIKETIKGKQVIYVQN